MNWKRETDEFQRKTNEYDKVKYMCSCGHRVIIPSWVDKQICNWCNNYVYKNKHDEFKDRMKEKLRRVANENV